MEFILGLAAPKSRVRKGSLQILSTPEAVEENNVFISIIGNNDRLISDVNIAFIYNIDLRTHTQELVYQSLGKTCFRAQSLAPSYSDFAVLWLSYHVSHSQVPERISASLPDIFRQMFLTSSSSNLPFLWEPASYKMKLQ